MIFYQTFFMTLFMILFMTLFMIFFIILFMTFFMTFYQTFFMILYQTSFMSKQWACAIIVLVEWYCRCVCILSICRRESICSRDRSRLSHRHLAPASALDQLTCLEMRMQPQCRDSHFRPRASSIFIVERSDSENKHRQLLKACLCKDRRRDRK